MLQAECNMNTDDDAELALKISNVLTQALLEHRQMALRAVVSSCLKQLITNATASNELLISNSFCLVSKFRLIMS